MRNIGGRAGRSSWFLEGDCILVDNPGIGAPEDFYQQRLNLYVERYVESADSPIGSSLDAISENPRIDAPEVFAAVESQFFSFIDVSNAPEQEESLAKS